MTHRLWLPSVDVYVILAGDVSYGEQRSVQHTVSETGGEQERRRLRSAAVTSAQNRPRLCILHSSASYRHSTKRKERGEEKRIKKEARGKGTEGEVFSK